VIFQTFDPTHPAIQAAVNQDAPGFLEHELVRRQDLALPPFHRAVMIRCEHEEQNIAEQTALQLASTTHSNVTVLGPIPAAIERLRGRFRFQVMATSKTAGSLQGWLDQIAAARDVARRSGVRIAVDVDPSELI
tara:strand:- start:29 stop:430 length:402 start_codon:yes stop_codon:yes gene_type:complete